MNNLSIGIGLCFYQDVHSLTRCLYSLQSYPLDYLIAIDGKFKEYPAEGQLSDQQCLDLIKSFQHPVRYLATVGLEEMEKRQKYFDECRKLGIDVLIVLDSDEYILPTATNWDLFHLDLLHKINTSVTQAHGYCLPTIRRNLDKNEENILDVDGDVQNLPKLFYRPSCLEYVGNLYTIRDKKTGVILQYSEDSVCHHIMIGHDHSLRSNRSIEEHLTYHGRLIHK
jgi:hypothetical protein